MKPNHRHKHPTSTLIPWAAALAVASLVATARATPYASGLTNDGGTIRFILNENADNVGVSFDNGAATNNLGVLGAGVNSFSLGAHTSYAIYASKLGAGSPVQISVDSSNAVKFNAPRGVAVNSNPKDRHFGLIYAANSTPGGTGAATKGRGVYIFNADTSDGLGRGTNASAAVFSSASSSSPYRLGLGPDGSLYIGDFSTAAATVWGFNADVLTGTNILGIIGENAGIAAGYHGDISGAPCAKGSLATGDLVLYTADAALGPLYNSIKQYLIGGGPVPWSNAPNQLGCIGLCGIAELNTDVALAPDGKLFGNINRVNFAAPNVTVFDTDGVTVLWDSITGGGGTQGTGPDVFQDAMSVAVSPGGKYVAAIHTDSHISVARLTNGIPDASSVFTIQNAPNLTGTANRGQQIAWDAAENIYTVSRGQGLLRIFSLGQTTTAITSNDATGTNGAFQLTTPATEVSVTVTTPFASQRGPTPGVFTLTRNSVNPSDLNQALTVNFGLAGTATNGVYTLSPAAATNTITFAPGQTATNLTITPVVDNLPRPTTTVILNLKGGGAYVTAAPLSATITIENIGPQLVFASGVDAATMYKRLTNDYASFILTRWGDTNIASYDVSSFTYGGTAAVGADFVGAAPVTFNPGDLTVTGRISPLIASTNYTGNKTVTVAISNGTGYQGNTVSNALLTLLDPANPPAPVLYANPLTNAADATNWNITFGNGDVTNNPADYNVDFGYDLTTDPTGTHGIIPPPPSGATTALRITANKLFNPGSAAGVNVYYTNQAFSGDYAVRFNLNLIQGGNSSYSTEGVLFGINHTGSQSNWWYGSGPFLGGPWASDGIWYYVTADPGGGGTGDYLEFTGAGGALPNTGWNQLAAKFWTAFGNVFKVPAVYTTVEGSNGGVPANGTPLNGHDASTWSDVEIKQVKKVVTLSINKTPVFAYTNTTSFTNGYLMLGYSDPYGGTGGASVGNPDAAAYFSNLRVVRLSGPVITSISVTSKTNVLMNFVSSDGTDSAASFALQNTGNNSVAGPYADVASAIITQKSDGSYQVTAISTNSVQFYRIRHK